MLRTLFSATILGGALAGTAAQAPDAGHAHSSEHTLAQGHELRFNSNADDITKICNLLEVFRQDILRKDGYALTKLMLYPNVLFHSMRFASLEHWQVRKIDGQWKILSVTWTRYSQK